MLVIHTCILQQERLLRKRSTKSWRQTSLRHRSKAVLGLTGNEKYDADMQERFSRDYLFKKAGGGALPAFVKDGRGSIDDAQYAVAQEWAPISAREVADSRR